MQRAVLDAFVFKQTGDSKLVLDADNLRREIGKFYDRFLLENDDVMYLSPYLDAYGTGKLHLYVHLRVHVQGCMYIKQV